MACDCGESQSVSGRHQNTTPLPVPAVLPPDVPAGQPDHGVEACVDVFHKADAGEAVVYFDFFVVFLEVVITDCFKAYDEIAEADLCEFFYEVFVFQNKIASSILRCFSSGGSPPTPI